MRNRVLSDKDRKLYSSLIETMYKEIPEIMNLKFKRSEVQAAFILDQILNIDLKNKKILCVGYDEDPVYYYLLKKNIKVIGIDPRFNYDLHTFMPTTSDKFDIIFSTSVIEHVQDDEQFMKDLCQLMNAGGIGLLTMDFLDNQPAIKYADLTNQFLTAEGVKNGIRMGREKRMELRRLQDQANKEYKKPPTDIRFYNTTDYKRLSKVMSEFNCILVDEICADVEPDFELAGCKYSFSTMVFKKLR
jgi:hypothetical protein